MNHTKRIRVAGAMLLAASAVIGMQPASGAELSQEELLCGTSSRTGRMPPEDYRKRLPRLRLVEEFHFGPNVEALLHPMQKGMTFGADIDYTLWAYPNHHRALATLIKLGAREKTDQPRGSLFSIDCYFRRALRFKADDHIVRMLYADYLGSVGRKPDALQQLAYVVRTPDQSALTHYNAGLMYLRLGAYEEAAAQALLASKMGLVRPGLRDELRQRGKWPAEPDPAQSTAAPDASGASAPPASAPPGG